MYSFQETACNDARGWADDGRGKFVEQFTVLPHRSVPQGSEHVLVEHLVSTFQLQHLRLRSLVLDYYSALVSSPLVLLVGAEPRASAAFAHCFAAAILGPHSPQVLAVSGAQWHYATGEDQHYRTVQQRFCGLRCQQLAQEANDGANVGKAYFVCFESLLPRELAVYTQVFSSNEPHVALTAAITSKDLPAVLSQVSNAAVVSLPDVTTFQTSIVPPPVGIQRLWLQARTQHMPMPYSINQDTAAWTPHRYQARAEWRETVLARYSSEQSFNEPGARRAA